MRFDKYKKNLQYVDGYVISYDTKVAKKDGDELIVDKWWSMTTSKHINYAARELGLTVIKLYEN